MKKVEGLGTDKILAHSQDGIGWLQFNNAEKHNAMSLEMTQASVLALEEFAADDAVRVVVLQGLGGKAFVTMTGDVASVQASVAEGRQVISDAGVLVNAVVISRPHPDVYREIV